MTSQPMRIAVTGAAGRMGQALVRAIAATPSTTLTLALALEREGADAIGTDAGELAGVGPLGVPVTAWKGQALTGCDALLDFTIPAATLAFAKAASQAGVAHVIGTTGCSAGDDAAIAEAAARTVIVKSGNMSVGVNLLAALTEKAAAALPPELWDIEVLEMHHRHKIDAPSGTALLLGAAAAGGPGLELGEASVRVRDGHTGARPEGAIGFATLRGGSVIGDHSVIFAGPRERLTLSHHAEDRSLFANGALAAALWTRGRKPGLYSMRDVLGL